MVSDSLIHDRVLANQWVVRCVARRFHAPAGMSFEDLLQEGNLGLIAAAAKFDPDCHDRKRFGNYANASIKHAISDGLDEGARTIPLSERSCAMLRKYRKAEAVLAASGSPPSRSDVYRALALTRRQRSWMDRVLVTAEIARLPVDDVPSEALSAEADSPCEDEERREFVRWALGRLDDRSRRFLVMHFGLDGSEPVGFREMADREGCCLHTAWNVTNRALDSLRALLEPLEIAG